MASVIIDKFFSIFWSDDACRKIFLLHKEELLEKKEVDLPDGTKTPYYTPRFVISNSLIRKDLSVKLIQRIENRELELGHELNSTTKRNIDENKIEEYFNKTFAAPIQEVTKRFTNSRIQ